MRKAKQGTSKPERTEPAKANSSKAVQSEADSDRESVLDEREKLRQLFPPSYSADIGVWSGDKVEVMLKLTYSQAVNLARLLKETKL
jgi:hypothetical protein